MHNLVRFVEISNFSPYLLADNFKGSSSTWNVWIARFTTWIGWWTPTNQCSFSRCIVQAVGDEEASLWAQLWSSEGHSMVFCTCRHSVLYLSLNNFIWENLKIFNILTEGNAAQIIFRTLLRILGTFIGHGCKTAAYKGVLAGSKQWTIARLVCQGPPIDQMGRQSWSDPRSIRTLVILFGWSSQSWKHGSLCTLVLFSNKIWRKFQSTRTEKQLSYFNPGCW